LKNPVVKLGEVGNPIHFKGGLTLGELLLHIGKHQVVGKPTRFKRGLTLLSFDLLLLTQLKWETPSISKGD